MTKQPNYVPVLKRDLVNLIKQIDEISAFYRKNELTDKDRNDIRKLRLFKCKYIKRL